jgi:PBP1b-binding outer membrane lipoprotein LpoB
MKKVTLFLGVAALLSSCSTAIPMATNYSYSEYQTVSPTQSVYTVPVIADLDVAKERITYAERINKNITTLTDAEVEALASSEKEVVIANAAKANNADVIVAPTVNIATDANKNLVIIVNGYPATYKNFRNATEQDKWIIEAKHTDTEIAKPIEKATTNPLKSLFKK